MTMQDIALIALGAYVLWLHRKIARANRVTVKLAQMADRNFQRLGLRYGDADEAPH